MSLSFMDLGPVKRLLSAEGEVASVLSKWPTLGTGTSGVVNLRQEWLKMASREIVHKR